MKDKKKFEEKVGYWCNRIDNLIMQANKIDSTNLRENTKRFVSSFVPRYIKMVASFQIVCTQLFKPVENWKMRFDLEELLKVTITRKAKRYIDIIFLNPEFNN